MFTMFYKEFGKLSIGGAGFFEVFYRVILLSFGLYLALLPV